jgi:iron complex transport system substrate-binding protein
MRLTVISLVLLLSLCSRARAAGEFTDGTGTAVSYGLQAQRIVSLAPNVTEMLYYCGFGDSMVGRSDYCDFPPEALRLPTVGGMVDTSLESIAALKPDLVVAYQGNSLELVGQLRELNIVVLAFKEAATLSDIGDQMEQLSLVAGSGESAAVVIPAWRKRLLELNVRPGARPTKVFYGMPGEVTYTAGGTSFIGDLIARAGGVNAAHDLRDRWPQVGAEFVLAAQPEWLLIGTSCDSHESVAMASDQVRAELVGSPLWSTLPAVQNQQLLVLDAAVLLRPGPRILEALWQLGEALGGRH